MFTRKLFCSRSCFKRVGRARPIVRSYSCRYNDNSLACLEDTSSNNVHMRFFCIVASKKKATNVQPGTFAYSDTELVMSKRSARAQSKEDKGLILRIAVHIYYSVLI
jgi:hypothetical protein